MSEMRLARKADVKYNIESSGPAVAGFALTFEDHEKALRFVATITKPSRMDLGR